MKKNIESGNRERNELKCGWKKRRCEEKPEAERRGQCEERKESVCPLREEEVCGSTEKPQ